MEGAAAEEELAEAKGAIAKLGLKLEKVLRKDQKISPIQ